jgi:multisubunit Na+/H+ antiporter MnhE subunit
MPRPAHGAVGLAFIGTRVLQTICLLVSMSLAAKFIEAMVDDQQAPPAPLVGILCVVCFAILYCGTTLLLYWDHQLPLLPTAGLDSLFFLALMISSIIIGKPLSYLSCKAASGSAGELIENVGQNLGKNPTTTTAAAAAAVAATTAPTVAAYTATTPTATYASTVVSYTTTTISNAAVTVAATLSPGSSTTVVGSDGKTYTISSRLIKRVEEVTTVDYANWIRGGTPSDCTMMKAVWGFGIALTLMFVFSAVMVMFIWKAGRAKSAPKQVAEGA